MLGARDGQLRIQRGTETTPYALQMYEGELGLWLMLAQANVEEDAMRAGIPMLRGPYVVDFSDIPHEGDTIALWTPEVGDVLLRLFCDWQTVTQWDHGVIAIGQGVDWSLSLNGLITGQSGDIGLTEASSLDLTQAISSSNNTTDGAGVQHCSSAFVFHSTVPLQVQLAFTGGTDPSFGHVELYALVARAAAI